MSLKLFFNNIFIIFNFALAANCIVIRCPDYSREGEFVTMGRYWYLCQQNYLVPKGCFADDRTRLNLYDSFKAQGFTIRCEFDLEGRLMFSHKACLINNVEYYPGQTWEDGKYWYSCERKRDDLLETELKGCVFGGIRYEINATVQKNGYLYQCLNKAANLTRSMCRMACVENGRIYKRGENFESGQFSYQCSGKEGAVFKKLSGCVFNDKKLHDRDRYVKENTVYECMVKENQAPEHRAVGCSSDMHPISGTPFMDISLGNTWPSGKFVWKCEPDGQGKTIMRAIRCHYEQGSLELEAGCFEVRGDSIAACRRQKSINWLPGQITTVKNNLELKIYPLKLLETVVFVEGLRIC